jgi:hypothetical protein
MLIFLLVLIVDWQENSFTGASSHISIKGVEENEESLT